MRLGSIESSSTLPSDAADQQPQEPQNQVSAQNLERDWRGTIVWLIIPLVTFFRGLVRTTTAEPSAVRDVLWGVEATERSDHSTALTEQYKIYVEMADRISNRRMLANTFFLGINTAALTLFGVFWQTRPSGSAWWLVFPLIALWAQAAAWFILLRSYRQLNTAKYIVIGVLEERMPASPYWRGEWIALGEGRDPTRYIPFTHVEQWVPFIFAIAYLVAFVAALLS